MSDNDTDDGGIERDFDDKPLGMSTPAWKGCSCSACRGERRRYLGRDELKKDQASLSGFEEGSA
jgi:hypothetical protein